MNENLCYSCGEPGGTVRPNPEGGVLCSDCAGKELQGLRVAAERLLGYIDTRSQRGLLAWKDPGPDNVYGFNEWYIDKLREAAIWYRRAP